jgi:hypothetical protein
MTAKAAEQSTGVDGQARKRRLLSVRATPRCRVALNRRKAQAAATLGQAVKTWRMSAVGAAQRRQAGVAAFRKRWRRSWVGRMLWRRAKWWSTAWGGSRRAARRGHVRSHARRGRALSILGGGVVSVQAL